MASTSTNTGILEITLRPRTKAGDAWPVVVEERRADGLPVRNDGLLRLDEQKKQKLLEWPNDPRKYGTVLGEALFNDSVRDAFMGACAQNPSRLRVLLSIEAEDLRSLRWERLCAPQDGQWDLFALNQRLPFSFYLPSPVGRGFPPIGRLDLRALLLAASPADLEAKWKLKPFDVKAAVDGARQALASIPCDVLADPAQVEDALGPPTLDELCERLTSGSAGGRYTLLHLICHGRSFKPEDGEKGGETVLYLEGKQGLTEAVTGTKLLERLKRLGGLPYLTFLSTCESASPEAEAADALGGLAQRMVRELGTPAVVAMIGPVSVDTAKAMAGEFYKRLREHGEVDLALAQAYAGSSARPDITVPALFSKLGDRPLFSDNLDRDLTDAEIENGLDQLGSLLAERAPVLRTEFEGHATMLRGTLGTDVEALSSEARSERDDALKAIDAMCGQALDVGLNALAVGQPVPAYDLRCPFAGLSPFTGETREFFFGRKALTEKLRRRLAEHNFLAALGPSGCGKSSLVLAGLVPALQDKEPGLRMAYLRPGGDPVARLEEALSGAQGPQQLIVVDQFEELFTLCNDDKKRRRFLDRLLSLAEKQRVVITMRADFLGECAPYTELKEAIQARLELVAPMTAEELLDAMESQTKEVGLRFEAGLSNTILEDVEGEPGAMPLLQHALLELWNRRHGRWLLDEEYRDLGEVKGAIGRTADQAYEKLTPGDRELVKDIFVRLARLDDDTQGEARRDTRRRVSLDNLVPEGGDKAKIKALVNVLADARLVVTNEDEEVEVAHEALIRHWPRLRGWLEEDRATLRLREDIGEAAQDWKANGKDVNYLVHRGGRLAVAEEVFIAGQPRRSLNELERTYLDACVALREREKAEEEERRQHELRQAQKLAEEQKLRADEQAMSNKQLRRRAVILAVVALLAIGAGAFAMIQRQEAQDQRQEAQGQTKRAETEATHAEQARATAVLESKRTKEQADIALSRQLAAQAVNQMDADLKLDLLLSLEANSITNTIEAKGSLLTILGSYPRPIKTLSDRSSGGFYSVAFSPDGKLLASGTDDAKTVILWDITTHKQRGQPLEGHDGSVRSVALSRKDNMLMLASGSDDSTIRLWDVSNPDQAKLVGQPLTHTANIGSVYGVAFSPDGTILASGTSTPSHTIILWDVRDPANPRPLGQPLTAHSKAVRSVAFNSDGTMLASGSDDSTIILWDVRDPANPQSLGQPLTAHSKAVRSVAFNSDGTMLASGSDDSTIRLWDVNSRQPIDPPLRSHGKDVVYGVAFRPPKGEMLASGTGGKSIILWDMDTRQPIGRSLRAHDDSVRGIAFSPDGKLLASGSLDERITLWETDGPQFIGQLLIAHDRPVRHLAFSPDSKLLASGSDDKDGDKDDEKIILWNIDGSKLTGQPFTVVTSPIPIQGLEFRHDGNTPASDDGANLTLWNEVGLRLVGWPLTPTPSTDLVLNIPSPDGKTLASGRDDGSVTLLDADSRKPIGQPLRGHSDPVRSLVFSSDSKLLASGSDDNTIILWDVDPESWKKRACSIANRNMTQDEWNQYMPASMPYRETCPDLPEGARSTPAPSQTPVEGP